MCSHRYNQVESGLMGGSAKVHIYFQDPRVGSRAVVGEFNLNDTDK